jgi:predicted TIM-barrel fold metal-dependent hydrolase
MHPLSKTFVDTHFHVFDAGVAHGPARYVPAYDAPLGNWQELALAQGVGRGVLVQPSFLGTDNSRLMDELRLHLDSLRGVAVVSADADVHALRAMDAAGVRGIRLNLVGTPGADVWSHAHALWDALLALDWHVEIHTDIGELPAVLGVVPDGLTLVVDHMGKPSAAALSDATVRALVARSRRSSVHVKLSGPYRLGPVDPAELARLWLGELGASSLLWGSDWPHTSHEADADYAGLLGALSGWVGEDVATAALTINPSALYWR